MHLLLAVTSIFPAASGADGGFTSEILDSLQQSYKHDDVRFNALAANPIHGKRRQGATACQTIRHISFYRTVGQHAQGITGGFSPQQGLVIRLGIDGEFEISALPCLEVHRKDGGLGQLAKDGFENLPEFIDAEGAQVLPGAPDTEQAKTGSMRINPGKQPPFTPGIHPTLRKGLFRAMNAS